MPHPLVFWHITPGQRVPVLVGGVCARTVARIHHRNSVGVANRRDRVCRGARPGIEGFPAGAAVRRQLQSAFHVEGVADPRRVYVTDRSSARIEVFDENGKFLDQFRTGKPSTPQVLFLSADKHLWIADNETSKIVKYDLQGNFLYSWGSGGQWPGAMWNVHGMSVDQDGNFYIAEVNNGRAQKFRPRSGANKAMLMGQPIRAAWR